MSETKAPEAPTIGLPVRPKRRGFWKWISDCRSGCRSWYRGLGWVKRRILEILAAICVAWLITAFVIWVALNWMTGRTDELAIGVLSAWIGELLFFTIVGAVVSVITLRDPASEGFDERVRILFGAGPDSVISYNKQQLARLAAYCSAGTRTVTIEDYSSELQAFRARIRTNYLYKNLLRDVDYDGRLPWGVIPDPLGPNGPTELGRILSINIDGIETIQKPQIIGPDKFTTELRLFLRGNATSSVVFEYWVWIKADELQELKPTRMIEHFSMTIVNQSNESPRVEIDADQRGIISLLYNQPVAFNTVQGVSPGERIFVYKLLPPVPDPAPVTKNEPSAA